MQKSTSAVPVGRASDLRREQKFDPAGQASRAVTTPGAYPFPLLAFLFVVIMILLLNVSCVPLKIAGKSAPADVQPGARLYADDFSDPPGGWGIWNRDGASVAYYEGGLRILVNAPQYDFWSVAGQQFADAQIEVDAARIGGPENNSFGIICRYQDKGNFYMLVASSDGYYGIAKMLDGAYSMIGAQQLQYTGSAIASGEAVNHLRADCVGSKLRLYANGQLLMETEDSTFSAGDVGVIAGAYHLQGVDILFDNFEVKKPR
jgi:hypothetical protein